jgi:N-methylhydantoinase B/oxoprolinase/acetone carboxylase alpha subunit
MQQGFIHNYLKLNYLGKPTTATTETLVAKESVLEEQLPGQTNILDAIAEIEAEHVVQEEVTEVVDYSEAIDEQVVEEMSSEIEDNFTEEEIAEVEEAKEIYETETKSDQITDIRIIAALQTEVNNIFGYSLGIEVYKADDSYSIITSDGQEVTVPISYVESLLS